MFIDQRVLEKFGAIKSGWADVLAVSPLLELDGNWPSVGVLDVLTSVLRGRSGSSAAEKALLSGAAAYLAKMAAGVWDSFGAEVRVEDQEQGVVISMTGGPVPERENFTIFVERDLKLCLSATPAPFPVVSDFARVLPSEGSIICPYAIGLMSGLAPSGEGPLAKRKIDAHKEPLEKMVKELSRQAGEHYARVFPHEPLGQVAELYLSGLIFPPLLMTESLPAQTAVHGLVEFFKSYRIPKKSILKLSLNLARSPDELISFTGLAASAALLTEAPSPELLGVARAHGTQVAVLRQAMLDVRRELGLRDDWIEAAELTEEDLFRIRLEKALGFIPWLMLSEQRLKKMPDEPELGKLVRALSLVDFPAAARSADKIIELAPSDIEMRIQRIFLDIFMGEVERACEGVKAVSTEPESSSNPRFFHIWGVTDMLRQDPETAVRHFTTAFNMTGDDRLFAEEAANNLAWAHIGVGDFERALEVLEMALARSPSSIPALINKSICLCRLGREEEAFAFHCRRIASLAPTDKEIMGWLAARKLLAG